LERIVWIKFLNKKEIFKMKTLSVETMSSIEGGQKLCAVLGGLTLGCWLTGNAAGGVIGGVAFMALCLSGDN
jgi:hypothetical protein